MKLVISRAVMWFIACISFDVGHNLEPLYGLPVFILGYFAYILIDDWKEGRLS